MKINEIISESIKKDDEVNEDSVNHDIKKTKLRKSADEVENLISEDDEDK